MSKNIIQDVKRKTTFKKEIFLHNLDLNFKEEKSTTPQKRSKLWPIAFISLIFLFFALSFFFAKATITITPRKQDLNLNQNFSASKDDNSSGLSFDLVVISGEENKAVSGGIEKDIQTKSKGQVIIYNNSTSTQTLVKNTILEGSNGKIYKTISKVVVPGMSKSGLMGKIEVSVYANNIGEDYNSAPLDFKIPIFKGTAKYTKIYARSKGDISGGLSGKYYEIGDDDKTKIVTELKKTLSDKLSQKIINQIPAGFILFKDAVFLNTNDNSVNTKSDPNSKDSTVNVTLKGTLYGFLFNEKKLTKKIAETMIDKYDGSDTHIPDIKELTFSLANKDISFADVKKLDFNLTGVSKITWDIDVSKIISSLLDKKKDEFPLIMAGYKNLDSASLKMSPPWKMSLPDKSKNIEIIINNP